MKELYRLIKGIIIIGDSSKHPQIRNGLAYNEHFY